MRIWKTQGFFLLSTNFYILYTINFQKNNNEFEVFSELEILWIALQLLNPQNWGQTNY